MTKQRFIRRLHKEKALLLVEPSDDIRDAYLKKSKELSHFRKTVAR